MENVVLVIHLLLALAIIGLVLLQRSEGGGLGIGGGGLGGLATPQGTANLLTRMTAICAAGFFCTSLVLGILAGVQSSSRHQVLDMLNEDQAVNESPLELEQIQDNEAETPAVPSAPIAE